MKAKLFKLPTVYTTATQDTTTNGKFQLILYRIIF